MKYSSNYGKLYKERYTTIRRYPKGNVGDVVREVYPNGKHDAKIIYMDRATINNMTTEFLLADTDCATREEAIALIQKFYPKPIDHKKEKLYVYYLRKINYKKEILKDR